MGYQYKKLDGFAQRSNADTINALRKLVKSAYAHRQNEAQIAPITKKHLPFTSAASPQHKASQMSLEDYMCGGYLDQIAHLYTPKELRFLQDFSENYERVHLGLTLFSLYDPQDRPKACDWIINNIQFRTGWQRILDIWPQAHRQTVGEHSKNVRMMAPYIFPNVGNEGISIEIASIFHDILEGPSGDFTPGCLKNPNEKIILDMLVCRLILESSTSPLAQTMREGLLIFEGNAPGFHTVRKQANDLDCGEMAFMAAHYEQTSPDHLYPQIKGVTDIFYDYIDQKLQTPEAGKFFETFMKLKGPGKPVIPSGELLLQTYKTLNTNSPKISGPQIQPLAFMA